MSDKNVLELLKPSELAKQHKQHQAEMDAIFEYDHRHDVLTINKAYPYHIGLYRITDFKALIKWTLHLSEKNWADTDLISEFIKRVCAIKEWELYKAL